MSDPNNLTKDELFNDIFGERRPGETPSVVKESEFHFETTSHTLDPRSNLSSQNHSNDSGNASVNSLNTIASTPSIPQPKSHPFRTVQQQQTHTTPYSQRTDVPNHNRTQVGADSSKTALPQAEAHHIPTSSHSAPQAYSQQYHTHRQQQPIHPQVGARHQSQQHPPNNNHHQQPHSAKVNKAPSPSPVDGRVLDLHGAQVFGQPQRGNSQQSQHQFPPSSNPSIHSIYNNISTIPEQTQPPLPQQLTSQSQSQSLPPQQQRQQQLQGSIQVTKGRLQPITTTDPSSAPVSQRYQQSPTTGKYQGRSPILQQGLNFLTRNSRNLTSPTLTSSSSFGNNSSPSAQTNPPSPGRSLSLNSSSFRTFRSSENLQHAAAQSSSKHHSKDSTKKTSSGRIIPQKFDINNNSNSGLGLKSRSFSSIAKSRRASSSTSLGGSHRVSSQGSISSRTFVTTSAMPPKVYPALLSRVVTLFKRVIIVTQHNKDGLEYRDSFTGAEAVDAIAYVIRTTDRNLALLLGRALDAQKFFHDVTYEHRLRDSNNEIYQFDEVYVNSADANASLERNGSFSSEATLTAEPSQQQLQASPQGPPSSSGTTGAVELEHTVNGVFTLLTECYSPTCTRDALCYSIACPRRLEQQARLNMKPQGGLKRNESHASLHDEDEKKQLWSHTVPKQLLDSLEKREVKRQELIYEVVATERTFVKNLEYIRDYWIRPLRESNIIPITEREKFIRTVFFNVVDILNVATRFRDALIRRQQSKAVVENIGDIFLEFIPYFEPFISYNAGQCFAKYELERQKAANPLFKRFIEETERLPESNRLNISSYLSQATTRTVRYNLLLKDIIKSTKEDSIDLPDLKRSFELVLKLLERINIKVGKAEDRHALILLKQRLVFRPGEYVDLKLSAENRKILYTAPLKKRNQDKDNQGDIQVYLLDHVLLFVRVKIINKREQHKVFQRPIPLPLLFISPTEEMPNLRPYTRRLGAYAQVINTNFAHSSGDSTKNPISFNYTGRRGYEITLYGSTNSAQESLISAVQQQQNSLRLNNDIFTLKHLTERFFDISNRINCLVPYDGGRKLLYGSDAGIFISEVKTGENGQRIVSKPVKIISKTNVTQLEVLEEYQTLLTLADKKLYALPLDILTAQDKRLGKEIMSHVSFFKVGVCGGKMLVCAAKSDMIRVFEPTDPFSKKMSKKKFKNETREFHFNSEPVSISFLKTRLIVGCTKGFEIVSLNDGKIESILDPADTSLDFITNREGLKPLAIHRISSNFLLSYSDFSFFINKNGWRTRSEWMINWEGIPQNFTLWYPYLLAFEPNFIEIRNVENGELLRVILGENIRLLHMGSQEILYAYEDERGYDVVASLDFWDKTNKSSESLPKIEEVSPSKERNN